MNHTRLMSGLLGLALVSGLMAPALAESGQQLLLLDTDAYAKISRKPEIAAKLIQMSQDGRYKVISTPVQEDALKIGPKKAPMDLYNNVADRIPAPGAVWSPFKTWELSYNKDTAKNSFTLNELMKTGLNPARALTLSTASQNNAVLVSDDYSYKNESLRHPHVHATVWSVNDFIDQLEQK